GADEDQIEAPRLRGYPVGEAAGDDPCPPVAHGQAIAWSRLPNHHVRRVEADVGSMIADSLQDASRVHAGTGADLEDAHPRFELEKIDHPAPAPVVLEGHEAADDLSEQPPRSFELAIDGSCHAHEPLPSWASVDARPPSAMSPSRSAQPAMGASCCMTGDLSR